MANFRIFFFESWKRDSVGCESRRWNYEREWVQVLSGSVANDCTELGESLNSEVELIFSGERETGSE